MGLSRYALYLHDRGSQFGFRLAMAAPERVTALIIQNGDIYEDEFVGELPGRLVERVSPELWTLSSAQLLAPRRTDIIVGLFGDQASTLADFPAMQAYLRAHRPPTLIAWGPHDGSMPEGAARAYLRDLPDACSTAGTGRWRPTLRRSSRCAVISSAESTVDAGQARLPSELNTSPTVMSPVLIAVLVSGPPVSRATKESKLSP